MSFVLFVLCSAAGYFAGMFVPDRPGSPYIPILLAYHLFFLFLVINIVRKSKRDIYLALSPPSVVLAHLACLGVLIGIVMQRDYVPHYEFLQYLALGLAPFEVNRLLKRRTHRDPEEPAQMPEGSYEEYSQFLAYMKERNRRFQKAGRTVHSEYAVWLKYHRRRFAASPTPANQTIQ